MSQIWALMTFPSTSKHLAANSTPTVAFVSSLNSFFVNRVRIFVFPTLLSPIRTTARWGHQISLRAPPTRRYRNERTFEEVIVVVVHRLLEVRESFGFLDALAADC